MKLIESASQNKGKKIVFTFDTGHTLTAYQDRASWITLPNRSRTAVATYWKGLNQKMMVAIKKGIE
jgi:hypothetical protein